MNTFIFTAESHGSKWMPIGRDNEGNEVWCDGCIVDDKHLCERIAANMRVSYNKGIAVAAKSFVQHSICIAKSVNADIL